MLESVSHYETNDADDFINPLGWEYQVYSINPKIFRYKKTDVEPFPGFKIERYVVEGPTRFIGHLPKPTLNIKFIDTIASAGTKLQGFDDIISVTMISTMGCLWDGLSDNKVRSVGLNFDVRLTKRILLDEEIYKYFALTEGQIGKNSVVLPTTLAARKLKMLCLQYLAKADADRNAEDRAIDDSNAADAILPYSPSDYLEDMVVEMVQNVVSETYDMNSIDLPRLNNNRRRLALEIEKLLWEGPFSGSHDYSLDAIAERFSVSRRTIQVALQQQFGLGFVALLRTIRLIQIRSEMRNTKLHIPFSKLMLDYHFNHSGRFSRDYKELFGISPSIDRKKYIADRSVIV
jgi:AraC-like DNA-binding protein